MIWLKVLVRAFLAVLIGSLIGSERARHGRAAGMRTHILVCLGAALTSMTSMYVANVLLNNGDVFRIPAQVVSGIGFLGAGMIILKNNTVITGLTTAAGVWATGVIGIAIGYGFYEGAIIVAAFCLISIVLLAKFKKLKKNTELIYIEIDDMYKANKIIDDIASRIHVDFTHQIVPPKSGNSDHIGINILVEKDIEFGINSLLDIENIVFVEAQ